MQHWILDYTVVYSFIMTTLMCQLPTRFINDPKDFLLLGIEQINKSALQYWPLISNIQMMWNGFYLQSRADAEQADKKFHRNSHPPNIDRLKSSAFVYKHVETTLGHMATAPETDGL